jgi:hypothetical protein
MRFVIRDPKKARPGSPEHAPARAAKQHLVPFRCISYHMLCFALPRDPARRCEKAALLISCAWYTSGKSLIAQKSDQAETGIR